MGPETLLGAVLLTITISTAANWGRITSLWTARVNLACWAIAIGAASASRRALARRGSAVVRAAPRPADLLLTPQQRRDLGARRERYPLAYEVCTDRELARLRFLHWLYQTGRLTPAEPPSHCLQREDRRLGGPHDARTLNCAGRGRRITR